MVKFCIPCQNARENHANCISGEFKPYKIKKQGKIGVGSEVSEEGYKISVNSMRSSGKWIDKPLFFIIGSRLMIIERTDKKTTFLAEGPFFDVKKIPVFFPMLINCTQPHFATLTNFYNQDYILPQTYDFDLLFTYRLCEQAIIKGRVYRVHNTTKRRDRIDELNLY